MALPTLKPAKWAAFFLSSEANDQSISIESVNGEVTFLEGPTMPENLTPLSGLRAFDLSGPPGRLAEAIGDGSRVAREL